MTNTYDLEDVNNKIAQNSDMLHILQQRLQEMQEEGYGGRATLGTNETILWSNDWIKPYNRELEELEEIKQPSAEQKEHMQALNRLINMGDQIMDLKIRVGHQIEAKHGPLGKLADFKSAVTEQRKCCIRDKGGKWKLGPQHTEHKLIEKESSAAPSSYKPRTSAGAVAPQTATGPATSTQTHQDVTSMTQPDVPAATQPVMPAAIQPDASTATQPETPSAIQPDVPPVTHPEYAPSTPNETESAAPGSDHAGGESADPKGIYAALGLTPIATRKQIKLYAMLALSHPREQC